jgi:hypothetical protein
VAAFLFLHAYRVKAKNLDGLSTNSLRTMVYGSVHRGDDRVSLDPRRCALGAGEPANFGIKSPSLLAPFGCRYRDAVRLRRFKLPPSSQVG